MSVQITTKRALPLIVIALASLAVVTAAVAYVLGSSWAAESAYAGGSSSESAACSSCCREDEPPASEKAADEPESCCADAAEVHKEAKRV
jgi:hypothetical protein